MVLGSRLLERRLSEIKAQGGRTLSRAFTGFLLQIINTILVAAYSSVKVAYPNRFIPYWFTILNGYYPDRHFVLVVCEWCLFYFTEQACNVLKLNSYLPCCSAFSLQYWFSKPLIRLDGL